jgi:hypothetical protein
MEMFRIEKKQILLLLKKKVIKLSIKNQKMSLGGNLSFLTEEMH